MKKITQTLANVPRVLRGVAIGAFVLCAAVAQAQTPVFTNVWSITNLTFPDLPAAGDTVRGMAISPAGNVVFASRTSSNHISTLDGLDGNIKLGSGVAHTNLGGTLALVGCRISDDGYVFGANLSGSPASRFVIYRWNSDMDFSTPPLVVFDSGSATSFQSRIGDYIDIRGSGTNTEIVAVGNGSGANATTNIVLFRPTDDQLTNFTATSITITNNSINVVGGGVTFDGTNNAVFVKQTGFQFVRRVVYDPIALTASFTTTFNMDQSANNGIKFFETNGYRMMATVTTATVATNAPLVHRAKILQLTTPSNAVVVLDRAIPGGANGTNGANANSLGIVDVRNGNLIFSEPNNGILYVHLAGFVTNTPPTVGAVSGGGTYVGGYPVVLSSPVSGPGPLSYFWYYNTNTLISTVTNSYSIPAANLTNTGNYRLIVSNAYGNSTSTLATLTVLPAGYSGYASNLWTLAPGSRPYLTTSDTQRGLAYDAVSNRVVVVSRSPSNSVYLLNGDTGADEGTLDVSLLLPPNPAPPGNFPINAVGVADDGAIYVANLLTSTTSDTFCIYRWQNADPTAPLGLAYFGNPAIARIGDAMAVRGAGPDTQILCSFRTGTNLALFLPNDNAGASYNLNVLTVTNLPADAVANGFAGLGLAFGPGNTFWAKSSGFNLRLVAFDTNDFNAHVVATFTNVPGTDGPLGADNVNGYVATVGIGQIPQNLSLWDVARGEPEAFQLDRELFGSNNANANGTGAVAFAPASRRLFALDSNNGIIAAAYSLYYLHIEGGGIVTWPGTGSLQSSTNLTSGYTDIPGATSPYTNTTPGQVYFRVRR